MPLDVQPLSLTRRIIAVLAMLGVLAASLGLAQWLIQGRAVRVTVTFPPPPGVVKLPVNTDVQEALEGAQAEARVSWAQGERRFLAFDLEDALDASPLQYLEALLERIVPENANEPLIIQTTMLGQVVAIEAGRHAGRGEDSAFAIIRLAAVERHIVAFCFSGDGVMTDADIQFFEQYCAERVEIRVARPTRRG